MPAGRGSTCPPRPVPCRQVVAGGGSSSTPKDARSRCRRESASISAASPRAWRWTPRSSACGRWASGRRWSAPGDLRVGRGRRQDRVHPRAESGHRLSRAQAPGGPAGGPVGCVAARRLLAGGLGRPGEGLVVASLSMTWVATRAAGYTAFALLTASVALGLLLSSPLRPTRWPRFATTELHRFVTLLTLLFIAIHVLVALLNSFIGFSLSDVLVPFTSNYRRVWMGLGIVSAYLAAALWAGSWLQRRIGYRWWRRLHFGTFGVYVGAALHGLGSGSDSGWAWSWIIHVASFALIGGLLVMRLPDRDGRRPPPTRAARPRASQAPPDAAGVAGVANGAAAGVAGVANGAPSAGSATGGGAVADRGFSARIQGRLWQAPDGNEGAIVQLEGSLYEGFDGDFQLRFHGWFPAGGSQLRVTDNRLWLRNRNGAVWWGRVGSSTACAWAARSRPNGQERVRSPWRSSCSASPASLQRLPARDAHGAPTGPPPSSLVR